MTTKTNTYTIRVKVTNSVGSELEESFSILITDDTSDNCDPDLDFTGDINNFGSLRVNQTDSLNPSETDYKIIALPFDGYFLSNLTSEMRSDQYKIRQWNGSIYFQQLAHHLLEKDICSCLLFVHQL